MVFGKIDTRDWVFVNNVVGDYFGLLRMRAAAGRFFTPAETGLNGAARVVVLGYDVWVGPV